jgi:predicted Zn-dependent peptidase
LAYSIRAGLNIYEDTGALIIQAGLDKARIDEALSVILKELDRIKSDLSPAEIKRGKEYLAGKTVLDLEDSASSAQWYGQQELLTGEMLTPEEKIAKIMALTKADLVAVAEEVINFHKLNLAIIGPFKDGDRFAKVVGLATE